MKPTEMKPTEMKPNSNIQNPTSKIQNPTSINQPPAVTPQDIVDGMYEYCGQWHQELMTDLICPVVGEVLGHSVGPSCLVLNLTLSGSVAGGPDLIHLSIFFGDGHQDEMIEVFAEDQGELTSALLRDTHDWAIAHLDHRTHRSTATNSASSTQGSWNSAYSIPKTPPPSQS
jgi:hypothetical protein